MLETRDLVLDIARQYLGRYKRAGPNDIQASCPFHAQDKPTQTLALSLTKGVFYCFSCEAKGTLSTFLRMMDLAPHLIEAQYGFLLKELDAFEPTPRDHLRPQLFSEEPLAEATLGFFDYCPTDLLELGFTEETLSYFDVGFDKKAMRVTYPLRNYKGLLEGISGRSVIGRWPKYKLYDTEYEAWGLPRRKTERRPLLWNFHNVYPEAFYKRGTSFCIVEGFKACMWVWQAGIKNVVALLGSKMTYEQQWLIERTGSSVYLFLDNNFAGMKGTLPIAARLSSSLHVFVVPYPDEREQPDNLRPSEIEDALLQAPTATAWALQNDIPGEFHELRKRSQPDR